MRHRTVILLGTALTASIAFVFAACGGDSTATDGGSDATTNDTGTGSDTGTGNDTGTPTDGGSDAIVGDGCASQGAGCPACCNTTYADAAAQLAALVYECACGVDGGGACASQCASSLCQGSQPVGQCNSCLNQGGQNSCNSKANTACSDAGCSAIVDCIASCP